MTILEAVKKYGEKAVKEAIEKGEWHND